MTNELLNVYDTYFVDCDGATLTCCGTSVPHNHCSLCDKKFTSRYKCERHFTQAHASRVVVVEGQFCFPCRLEHNGKSVNRAHYHCPYCDKTIFIRNRFIKHVESHAKQKQATSKETTTNLQNVPNVSKVEPNPPVVNHPPPDLENSTPELEHPPANVEFLQRDLDCALHEVQNQVKKNTRRTQSSPCHIQSKLQPIQKNNHKV